MNETVIISASYKTDIPTFYGEWFMNRLRAGYCKVTNAYNRRAYRLSLMPEDLGGIVFWTKNVGPFMRHLPEISSRGIPFVVQYTINGYPRAFEQGVVNASKSAEHVRRISDEYGQRVCVWRYDTIIISSETPWEFHLRNFEKLAELLEGAVDEVVISFVQVYRKTLRNMRRAAQEFGFTWEDPHVDDKRRMARRLVEMAGGRGMRLSICSQRNLLVEGATDAHCVDIQRLSDVGARAIRAEMRGARKECGCYASRDVGDYDTCPHGCVYCYAVLNRELAQHRFRLHDPTSEFLYPPADGGGDRERGRTVQLPLLPQ